MGTPEENQLLGFPEDRKTQSTFSGKKQAKGTRGKPTFAEKTKKAPAAVNSVSASGNKKPLLYENDENGLSPWSVPDGDLVLHKPIRRLNVDGKEMDPSIPGAIHAYNKAKDVILEQ